MFCFKLHHTRKIMNILIIGNGFDLAHKLPTTYTDILKFFKIIRITSTWAGDKTSFINKHICNYDASDYIKTYIKDAFSTRQRNLNGIASNSNLLVQEIYDNLTDNIWYEYLLDVYEKGKMKGINWIDFESEISSIIEQIDRFQENLSMPFDIKSSDGNEKLRIFLSKLEFKTIIENKYSYKSHKQTYQDFLDKSYYDLRRFVRCMEIYLLECVEKQPINILSQDIINTNANYILCFNYTHTYKKLYDNSNKAEIHYLHGETQDNIDSNNMVLGINEYYSTSEKDQHTNYNIYKKFTQRVINETGFLYRKWIAQMDDTTCRLRKHHIFGENGTELPNNVYIFGHSLDITDKDIIKDFIDRNGVKTTIFFYNKQQQTQQIANLIKMLGQDKFINMINSVPQRICFVQQQPMIAKT